MDSFADFSAEVDRIILYSKTEKVSEDKFGSDVGGTNWYVVTNVFSLRFRQAINAIAIY